MIICKSKVKNLSIVCAVESKVVLDDLYNIHFELLNLFQKIKYFYLIDSHNL
jgi:hypothetical protein